MARTKLEKVGANGVMEHGFIELFLEAHTQWASLETLAMLCKTKIHWLDVFKSDENH